MKVLQITPTLVSGGGERLVVDLSNELIDQGHEVHLCNLFDINKKKEYSFFKNELNPKIKLHSLNKVKGYDITQIFKLIIFIKKLKPDVVHSHLSVINYIFLAVVFFNKKKFVHTLHSDARKLNKNKIEYYISRFTYNRKNMNPVCISEESLNSYTNLYNTNKKNMIYNGRISPFPTLYFEDVKEFIQKFRTDNNNIFLHVGRISNEKNQLNLIKGFIDYNSKDYLIIIGDGDTSLKKTLMEISNDNIIFLGRKNNVIDYMMNADFFILPSIFEGMPITVIESLSVGCIPICSPVGGMLNMINHSNNGFLTDGTKSEDISKALTYVTDFSDSKKRNEIKNEAVNTYKSNYNIIVVARQYIELYKHE